MMMSESERIEVLLVEDDPPQAELIRMGFEEVFASVRLHHVVTGEDALRFLRRQPPFEHAQRPHLILLDLMLPGVDGHSVLIDIKRDPRLKAIPVIVLTTSKAEVDRMRAYEEHANSYLVKPFDLDEFLEMIHDLNAYWIEWNAPPPLN